MSRIRPDPLLARRAAAARSLTGGASAPVRPTHPSSALQSPGRQAVKSRRQSCAPRQRRCAAASIGPKNRLSRIGRASIQTIVVEPGTPELAICARWRATAFSVLQASFEEELRSLELFASDQTQGVALVAKVDGEPIGTCLLVGSEIEPNHEVSPWLAGLFVVPERRRKGAGTILVRAIEDQARQRGFSRLYLYTTDAVGFYARLGWSVLDRTNWRGLDTALMVRDL